MRKSRVLLAGAAVAAAAVATSAFTAGFTVDDSVAGYGEGTVTGATLDNIHYVPNAVDSTFVDAVEFSVVEDVTGGSAILTLKNGTNPIDDSIVCSFVGVFADTGKSEITCPTTGTRFDAFDSIGLTVVQ